MSEGGFDKRAGIVLAASATVEITSDKTHRHNEETHSKKQVDTDVPLAGAVVVAWTLVAVKVWSWSDGRRRNLPVAITNSRSLCLFNGFVRCPSPEGVGNHEVLLRDRGFIDVGESLCRFHVRAGICFFSQCQKKRTSCQNVLRRQHLFDIRLHVDPRFTVQWCLLSWRSHTEVKSEPHMHVCDTVRRVDMRRRDDLNCAGP